MTVSAPGRTRLCVTVELDDHPAATGDVVLAAALQLFTPADPVEVALFLRDVTDLDAGHGEAVLGRCQAVCAQAAMPDVVLLAAGEAPEHPVVLAVAQTGDAAADARAIVLLANLARQLWDDEDAAPSPAPAPTPAPTPRRAPLTLSDPTLSDPALSDPARSAATDAAPPSATPDLAALLSRLASATAVATGTPATAAPAAPAVPAAPTLPAVPAQRVEPSSPAPDAARPSTGLTALRRESLARIAEVDATRAARLAAGEPIRVAVVVQHLDSWGALETLTAALAARDDVRLDVVALDSELSRFPGETASVLAQVGVDTRDVAWARAQLADLDVAVLCDGYDAFRPHGLRVPDFTAAGVRLVYSPYGTNIGGAATQEQRQYNGILHNVAWRVLAPTPGQKALFGAVCEAGDGHVRTLGSVKRERVLRLLDDPRPGAALRKATGAKVNVLWNPHFTVGDDGWSTFLTFVAPMLRYFTTRSDLGLIVRPHFRLLPDLRLGAHAGLEKALRSTVAQHRSIVLDESRDYLAAFAASDALVSDQSSLIPEYLPLRKPVLHLRRNGSGPLNADAAWVGALPGAQTWGEVARFLGTVAGRRAAAPDADTVPAEHFGADDAGAGARAAAMVVDDLRAEVAG